MLAVGFIQMKIKEAQEIVSAIVNWQMVLQGVIKKDELKIEIDLNKYTLEDLIKANKIIIANNSRTERKDLCRKHS